MNSDKDNLWCGAERRDFPLLIAGLIWAVVYLLALLLMKNAALSGPLKLTLAIVPAIPFAVFLTRYIGHLQALDELHRRVHLEALAIAFPLTILLLMTLGLLERAQMLSSEDWSYRHVWYYLPFLYAVGLVVAWRRYK